MVVALAALSRLGAATPYLVIVALHVGLMVCLAAIFTPIFTVGLGDLPEELYSHGSSLLGTLQQVAGAVGTAALIVVLENRSTHLAASGASGPEAFLGGLHWAFALAAVIGVVVVACALLLPAKAGGADATPEG